jgi:hypothetical protein
MRESILVRIIIAIPVLVLLALYILYISQIPPQDDWKERTTPLPKETRDLLCSRLGLSSNDHLCNGNKDVYALDFVRIIGDTFRPYEKYGIQSSEAATYDDVEKKIGKFKYECEPDVHQADGLTYFYCSYDLRGDREFVMTFLYTYPEKAVMRIMSTSRFDD